MDTLGILILQRYIHPHRSQGLITLTRSRTPGLNGGYVDRTTTRAVDAYTPASVPPRTPVVHPNPGSTIPIRRHPPNFGAESRCMTWCRRRMNRSIGLIRRSWLYGRIRDDEALCNLTGNPWVSCPGVAELELALRTSETLPQMEVTTTTYNNCCRASVVIHRILRSAQWIHTSVECRLGRSVQRMPKTTSSELSIANN